MIRIFRPRFSIRTLLIAMACIAIFLATFVLQIVMPWEQESRLIAKIAESSPNAQLFTEPKGQLWFRHFFGDRYSQRLVYVHLDGSEITDEWLSEHLSQLKHVEVLSIKSPNVTDAGLQQLKAIPNLKPKT